MLTPRSSTTARMGIVLVLERLNAGYFGRGVSKKLASVFVLSRSTVCSLYYLPFAVSAVLLYHVPRLIETDDYISWTTAQYIIICPTCPSTYVSLAGTTGSHLTYYPYTRIASTMTSTIRKGEHRHLPDSINHLYLLLLAPTLAR